MAFDRGLDREEGGYEYPTGPMMPMILVLCLAVAGLLIGMVVFAVWLKRRRATPEELRGDWWPDFEDEFRAYARRCEMPGARRERRSPPSRPAHGRDLAEGSA